MECKRLFDFGHGYACPQIYILPVTRPPLKVLVYKYCFGKNRQGTVVN